MSIAWFAHQTAEDGGSLTYLVVIRLYDVG